MLMQQRRNGEQGVKTPSSSRVSVLLAAVLLLVELTLLLNSRVLVLLVLAHQVVHVRLSLRELHLVHTLAGVPMQKRLATEHRRELLAHALEHLLDASVVADEGARHLPH